MLATLRYRESSKIVRLATRELGVQSVIAKGALRPRSRFGAALQLFSEGAAMFHYRPQRDLHTLSSFDPDTVRLGLTSDLRTFSAASVMAELMIRFAPAEAHPESYATIHDTMELLAAVPAEATEVVALRGLWGLVASLGFRPSMDCCARDGAPLAAGPVSFSPADGGLLCRRCSPPPGAHTLSPQVKADLEALLDPAREAPLLDDRHAAAHRRLLARYVAHHLAEGQPLTAMDFWLGQREATP